MVNRVIILIILCMYPFALNGTSDNNPPASTSNKSEFPALQVTETTPTDENTEEVTKLSPSQIEVIEKVRAAINRRDRTILIKSVMIAAVGGMTMLAIGKLK